MSHSSALYPRLETIFVKQLYWIFSEYYFTTHRLCIPKIQSCFIHNFELISLSFDGILQENEIKGKKTSNSESFWIDCLFIEWKAHFARCCCTILNKACPMNACPCMDLLNGFCFCFRLLWNGNTRSLPVCVCVYVDSNPS